MRVLICGDRFYDKVFFIEDFVKTLPKGSVVIQGECPFGGADLIAKAAAEEHGYEHDDYPADWTKFGKGAGPIRNTRMIKEGKPDVVVAFHDNISSSKGSKNMLAQARFNRIPTLLNPKHINEMETQT